MASYLFCVDFSRRRCYNKENARNTARKVNEMRLIFSVNTFENDHESILDLLVLGAEHNRVKQYLCSSFNVDINMIDGKSGEEINAYLRPVIYAEYTKAQTPMNEKLAAVSDKWSDVKEDVINILQNIFGVDIGEETLRVFLSVNYVCPYDFENKRIFINYRKTTDEIIEACIHELIHYYWFKKWNIVFEDPSEFDEHLVWKFSEIAIDAVFKETELNKYCVREKPAHEHFYDIETENENMIGHFRALFSQNTIDEFMKEGMEYLVNNRNSIPD